MRDADVMRRGLESLTGRGVDLDIVLSDDVLRGVRTAMSAHVALVLQAYPGRDHMRVLRRSGPVADDIPPAVFAPLGSLLARLCRRGMWSRLPMLPLMGVPGSGHGRGLGPALVMCSHHADGVATLLVIARLPNSPRFTGVELARLRRLVQTGEITLEHR